MYGNRNYVNPAVKFKYPNAIELRPLKCCICPKLTPGLKNFDDENACFVHLVTLTGLTICSLCILTIGIFSYFLLWQSDGFGFWLLQCLVFAYFLIL